MPLRKNNVNRNLFVIIFGGIIMKDFNQLDASHQKARLTRFANQRKQYDLLNGLFRITKAYFNGERQYTDKNGVAHTALSFGYVVVTAGKKNNEEGLDGFYSMSELVVKDQKNADVAIEHRRDIFRALKTQKSVLVSLDYRLHEYNGKTYREINGLRRVQRHAKQKQAQVEANE